MHEPNPHINLIGSQSPAPKQYLDQRTPDRTTAAKSCELMAQLTAEDVISVHKLPNCFPASVFSLFFTTPRQMRHIS